MALLTVRDVHAGYGPLVVLHGVSIDLQAGELVACLGPNGSGKTTVLRVISGIVLPSQGQVLYETPEAGLKSLHSLAPHAIVNLGISHVPQGRRLFANMTVLDNLLVGGFTRKVVRRRDAEELVEQYFPELKDKLRALAKELSGGQQQMAAIARALMSNPRLLLLDEPSIGLAPKVIELLGVRLRELCQGLAVTALLVEQNMGLAIEVASRTYVLRLGRVVWSGSTVEVSASDLAAMYLS